MLAVFLAGGHALGADETAAALERARKHLAESNPRQAFVDLVSIQDKMAGDPAFDYLLGVAALDSTRYADAIIAFERVLSVNPAHAGAQMDLARAYFVLGDNALSQATFLKLKASNPPAVALQAINRYLEAIDARRRQQQPGWIGFTELSMGYDSNLTGVPGDFGAAAQQAFNIAVDPTGNAVKRSAAFAEAQASLEYRRPLSHGWSLFAGGGARARGYRHESDFNIASGELRAGGARDDGPRQWRLSAGYQDYRQQGAAPGEPRPTSDRRTANVAIDWRHAIDTRTQLGLGLQLNQVRFPDNPIDDFDQVFVSAAWLKTFQGNGVPLLYVTAFATEDRARNTFADGVTDKSKNLGGLRSHLQYSLSPKLQAFGSAALIYRRDKDPFARSTTVEKGRDTFAELTLGLTWQFREKCAVRTQWTHARNESNIDIFDFSRNEVSTAVRCDLF